MNYIQPVDNMNVSILASEPIELGVSNVQHTFGSDVYAMAGKVEVGPSCSVLPSMLEKSLEKCCSFLKRAPSDNDPKLSLHAVLVFGSPPSGFPSYIRLGNKVNEDNFFTRLERACGGFNNLSFQMELILRPENITSMKLEATGLKVEMQESQAIGGIVNTIFHKFKATEVSFESWKGVSKVSGELSLQLQLTDAAFHALQMDNLEDPFSTCRAIRADTVSTDALIIVGGGAAEVRCHKGFLSAHSPVFKAMFESGMKEGTTSTVELPDMTEDGVHALLDYLYCWDMKAICQSSPIAVERLVAADKYNIPRLQNSIQELVVLKDVSWFTIPAAIQLFRFVKNRAPEGDVGDQEEVDRVYKAMEAKSVAVLRSKSAQELNECAEYQELFEDPQMGKEICTYFMLYPVHK